MKQLAAYVLLTSIALLSCPNRGAAEESTGTKVYTSGLKSSVLVENVRAESRGSGSVVNLRDGYIITNHHVVRGGSEMLILFPLLEKNGRPVTEVERYLSPTGRKAALFGRIVTSDERVDLAIIKLLEPNKIPRGTQSVKFAPDKGLSPGAKVYSIGNPGASEALWVFTPGDVRQVYKKRWASRSGNIVTEHEAMVIESTSPTSPGDSGGPCFNEKGEQCGVTQGGLKANVAQGYSYFIDSEEVKAFLKKNRIAFNLANDATKEVASTSSDSKKDSTLTKNDAKEAPKVDSAAAAKEKSEAAAASMLKLIRPLAKDPNRKTFVTEKLQQLIKTYPKTEAAAEAQTLLKKIGD